MVVGGRKVGVGITVKRGAGGDMVVSTVKEGGPAAASGRVVPRDALLAVVGPAMSAAEVGAQLVGLEGSAVRLRLRRAGEEFDVELPRAAAPRAAASAADVPPRGAAADAAAGGRDDAA